MHLHPSRTARSATYSLDSTPPGQSGVRDKICWALYKKDDCKELLYDAIDDMTALEAVQESAHKIIVDRALQTLARRQAELLTKNELLQVLAPVAKIVDTKLLLAMSSVGKSNGTEIHLDKIHCRGPDKVQGALLFENGRCNEGSISVTMGGCLCEDKAEGKFGAISS